MLIAHCLLFFPSPQHPAPGPGSSTPAALLKLLSAPARTGIIPPHFRLNSANRFRPPETGLRQTRRRFATASAQSVFVKARPPTHVLPHVRDHLAVVLQTCDGRFLAELKSTFNVLPSNVTRLDQTVFISLTDLFHNLL